jgi:DNA gyrase subunit A
MDVTQAREQIRPVLIEQEMKDSYLTFAMSVIMSRAIPDVRDGLKPSQRRILVAMNDLDLGPRSKFRKCAKIVGDTTGNYHPHGQENCYPTLVRMAQDFNFRYPLVDGQGNFGSIDGDPPAAMRYTEARLTSLAMEMLDDLSRDTVDMVPNYDETRVEPTVLPSRFPNLLCNGASGIAVGMATSIPPHNLREVCDGIIKVIGNPDVTVEELMTIVKGPDFPTGALICGTSGIRQGYLTGRGSCIVRARAHVETTKSGKKSLVFTEIPYLLNRDKILERIGELVKEGVLEGIADVRNESDKEGTRIVVDLKKGEEEQVVLNQLYKHTALQDTFSINMIAIVGNRPLSLGLKELIVAYIDHRKDVIRRRTQYLLNQAEAQAHILQGLMIALRSIDEIIALIKASETVEAARTGLMEQFSLSQKQAEAILQMRLQRLTGLEQAKIQEELNKLLEDIESYRAILADENLVLDIIREDLYEIREKHGDDRRTEIIAEVGDFHVEDLIAEETMAVIVSHEGYIKRLPLTSYRRQNRGGKGVTGADIKEGDFVEHLFTASTHDYILFFTDKGKIYWQKVYDIPQLARAARGRAIQNLLSLEAGEKITSMIPVREFDNRQLVMATRLGTVKKTDLSAYGNPKKGGIIAILLEPGDELIGVRVTNGQHEVVLGTEQGMAIRFSESDVRSTGRATHGVKGIALRDGDKVVDIIVVDPTATLLTVCENGFGKRTSFEEYRTQGRGGLGLINIKTTERNGRVVALLDVRDEDEVMMISQGGMIIRTPISTIRPIGRNTQGVTLISLNEGDKLVAVARVAKEEGEEAGGGEPEAEPSTEAEGEPKAGAPESPPADDQPPGQK